MRHRWPLVLVSATGRFAKATKAWGLRLRSQIGGAVGPRLINSNQAQMFLGEVSPSTTSAASTATRRKTSRRCFCWNVLFHYDQPRTNVDLQVFSYIEPRRYRPAPSAARCRLQTRGLEGFLRCVERVRHIRQPAAESDGFETNDVGTVLSVGWTY